MEAAFLEEVIQYRQHINEGLQRATRLVLSSSDLGEMADEVLRAVVVLTHAYLEDFLRQLAQAILPTPDESVLNEVPLAGGRGGRPEKFLLGRLTRHRGKSVDDVIGESVSEYLERSNFNSTTEIVSFLENLGLVLENSTAKHLPALEQMIQRRHLIVHRADRTKIDTGGYTSAKINKNEVVDWVMATSQFMSDVLSPFLIKRWPPEVVESKFNVKIKR
jgi:hypothetical protein